MDLFCEVKDYVNVFHQSKISIERIVNITDDEIIEQSDLSRSQGISTKLLTVLLLLLIVLSWIKRFQIWDNNTREKTRKGLNSIPGPKSLWLIGNAHQITPQNAYNVLTSWCKTYGPIMKIKLGLADFVILSDSSYIQKLYALADNEYLNKGFLYNVFTPFWNDGLIVSRAEKWRQRRKLLSRAFTYKSFIGYMQVYNSESKRIVKELDKMFQSDTEFGQPIDKLLFSASLRVVCETTLGSDLRTLPNGTDMQEALHRCKTLCMTRIVKPWLLNDWIWSFHPGSKELQKGVTQLEQFTSTIIQMHQSEFKSVSNSATSEPDDLELHDDAPLGVKKQFRSLIEEMMKAGINHEGIVEEAKTMITSGYETTASTLQFLLYLLALHPNHQEMCREELDEMFQNNKLCPEGNFTFEAIGSLKHLEKCLLETLRLFSVVFLTIRTIEKSLKFDDGIELPSGTNVMVFSAAVHHDPKNYPNPHLFDPERFSTENMKERSPHKFIPFSTGPRNCIGYKYGMLEIKSLTARILRHYYISTTDKIDDVSLIGDIVRTPERGYNFRFTKRQDVQL